MAHDRFNTTPIRQHAQYVAPSYTLFLSTGLLKVYLSPASCLRVKYFAVLYTQRYISGRSQNKAPGWSNVRLDERVQTMLHLYDRYIYNIYIHTSRVLDDTKLTNRNVITFLYVCFPISQPIWGLQIILPNRSNRHIFPPTTPPWTIPTCGVSRWNVLLLQGENNPRKGERNGMPPW